MKKNHIILLAVIVCAAGMLVGWLYGAGLLLGRASATAGATTQVRADLSSYKFINPPLYSDTTKYDSPGFDSLQSSMSSFISSSTDNGFASSVSVYFRDLNGGHWTGVNEDDTYTPSSMLKVLVMMSAFKVAENDPSVLSEQLPYKKVSTEAQYYKPENGLEEGYYPLRDLVQQMVKYSDNDALGAILADKTINTEFSELYKIFRLPDASNTDPKTGFMSPKSFSTIFRVLYNSSLFQWSLSEQILATLSGTTFNKGLVAGVPPSVSVAHKFGEYTAQLGDGTVLNRELHDCGIVYYPGHPFLLCVMTKGSDFPKLESVISGISKLTYVFVSSGRLK